MNGPPNLVNNGIQMLKGIPRSTVVLILLCILALGAFTMGQGFIQRFLFILSDETEPHAMFVFLADLNGDEHQDAFLVTNQMHRILFNDGNGNFTLNRELMMRNYALALGDLNGNGQLDAILMNFKQREMILECGEMSSDYVFPVGTVDVPDQVFAIRDGNRDGIPEDYIAGCCGGGTTMMNYATSFSNYRSCLGAEPSTDAALGDLNGDGSLDVFLAKGWRLINGQPQNNTPNEVWFNDGLGNFTDSGQRLGNSQSFYAALGDLNNDSFLDAVVGNREGGEVWFNDGQGNFTRGSQRLGRGMTGVIFIADLDGDGDLDLFLGGDSSLRAWLNDGAGHFKSGQRITFNFHDAVSVGDVTGDGVPDIFVGGPDSYQVWRGDGNGRFSAGDRSSYR